MESIANYSKIAELKQQLSDLYRQKAELPRLSLEDHEDCNDNYQVHLELKYEIDGLRDEIKALECQNGD